MEPRRLAYIDALRGWAMLLEAFAHAAQGRFAIDALTSPVWGHPLALPPPLALLAAVSISGIQLFFVVSALSLTLSWQSRGISGPRGVRDYLIRRFLRVAPLFYTAIAFYLILYGWGPRLEAGNGIGIGDVVATAAFVHVWRWTSLNSVVPGDQALGCLAMFWLVLPVILLIARARWRLVVLTLVGVVCTQLLQAWAIAHRANAGPLGYHGFPAQAVVFLFGIWAAVLTTSGQNAGRLALGPRTGKGLSLALFVILVLVLPFLHLPLWLVVYRVQFGVVAALTCAALHRHPAPIVVNRVTVRIGRVSASMYVWQWALLAPCFHAAQLIVDRLAGAPADDTLLFLVYFPLLVGASFAVASVTYPLIERPFIRLGRRLTGGSHHPVAEVPL
jgi:exopolysaccharide production protein ExoZ